VTFCERVVEALIVKQDGFVWPPLQPDVSFVWERTLPTSPLRRMIKEIWLTMPISMAVQTFKDSPKTPYTCVLYHRRIPHGIGLGASSLYHHPSPSMAEPSPHAKRQRYARSTNDLPSNSPC